MAPSQYTVTAHNCPACSGAWPRRDHHLTDLGLSKVYLHDDQFFPGWTVVVFQHHATELFHLAPTERIQLMEEVNLIAKTLAQTYQARKVNYELLGNQLPHIHWHLIPRLATDPNPLEPVWKIKHKPVLLSEHTLQNALQRLKQAIHEAH